MYLKIWFRYKNECDYKRVPITCSSKTLWILHFRVNKAFDGVNRLRMVGLKIKTAFFGPLKLVWDWLEKILALNFVGLFHSFLIDFIPVSYRYCLYHAVSDILNVIQFQEKLNLRLEQVENELIQEYETSMQKVMWT